MANTRHNKIFQFLKSQNWHYSETWVKDCVDYYIEGNPSIREDELKQRVEEQWLLLDLREVAVAAFPPNLSDQHKVNLAGKYAVQVETMVDSGRSRYSQYQSLCKSSSIDNIEVTSKPKEEKLPDKRCITMTVTDGVQTLKAMEYELIPELKLNDPEQLPGFKMLIIGPVMCRRGMIMLARRNVKVLGGEVSTLLETNQYEALLRGVLGIEQQQTAPALSAPAPRPQEIQNLMDDDEDVLMDLPLESIEASQTDPTLRVPTSSQASSGTNIGNSSQQRARSYNNRSQPSSSGYRGRTDHPALASDDEFKPPPKSRNTSSNIRRKNNVPKNTSQISFKGKPTKTTVQASNKPAEAEGQLDDLQDFFNDDFDMADVPDFNDNDVPEQEITSTQNFSTASQIRSQSVHLPSTADYNAETLIPNSNQCSRAPSSSTSSILSHSSSSSNYGQAGIFDKTTQNKIASSAIEGIAAATEPKAAAKKRKKPGETESFLKTQRKQPLQQTINQFLKSPDDIMDVSPEPRSVSSDPYVYLEQICKMDLEYDRLFRVKAQILTLKTKIGVKGDSFALTAKICDGSYSVDVEFSSDILENMLGFSPSELIVMLREKKRNAAVADKLAAGFQSTQQRLISLNCIFCLKCFKDKSITPLVVNLEEVTANHIRALRLRQI